MSMAHLIAKVGASILLIASTANAQADCIADAAMYHHVNVQVLYAIAKQESGLNPNTIVRNKNGTIDVGLFGINSVHFPQLSQYGISPQNLLDPCVNAYVGAWLYAQKVNKFGNTWDAVGAYHSLTPTLKTSYATSIQSIVFGIPRRRPMTSTRDIQYKASKSIPTNSKYAFANQANSKILVIKR